MAGKGGGGGGEADGRSVNLFDLSSISVPEGQGHRHLRGV